MAVAHEGGIFVTSTLYEDDAESAPLRALNERVLTASGCGAARRIPSSSARPRRRLLLPRNLCPRRRRLHRGRRRGRNRPEPVARVGQGGDRRRGRALRSRRPPPRQAGIVLSLARQECAGHRRRTPIPRSCPASGKPHHAGLIVASTRRDASAPLLDLYVRAVPGRLPRVRAATGAAARLMAAASTRGHAPGARPRLVAATRERA